MKNLAQNSHFRKFHLIFWAVAGIALFISGWTQSNILVSLTRNAYLTIIGIMATFLLAKNWEKISNKNIRNSLIYFLPSFYVLGMALVIPINPVTFAQLDLSFNEFTLRHLFAGTMNFGLVFLFWSVLYFFFFKKGHMDSSIFPVKSVTLEVKTEEQTLLISAHQISHLRAAADYVEIHLNKNKSYLKRSTIASLLKSLKPHGFIQVHRSIVINQTHLAGFEGISKGSYTLIMSSGARLKTSRQYRLEVEALLAKAEVASTS